jgi:CRP/FNR family cyclic AMP-dependent transcriptional regulator
MAVRPEVREEPRVPGRPDTRSTLSAELAQLRDTAPTRSYRRGERVFRPGDPSDGFFVVDAGRVKLTVPGGAGGEQVLALYGAGEVFGCLTGEGGLHRTEVVSLIDDTRVVAVSHRQFDRIAQLLPSVALAVSQLQAQRVQALEKQLGQARLPVQARLAHVLLDLTQRFGDATDSEFTVLRLDFHHEDLASLAGTTRVRATQALSAWRQLGLVTGTRGQYRVNTGGLQVLLEELEAQQVL